MADALVSALASTVMSNLNSLLLGEFAAAGGFRTELNNLESTLTTIQAVLHDAEEKQGKSEAIKNWLRKLKDAAYEADDLLDEIAIQAQRRRLPKSLTTHVRCFFSDQNPVVFKVKMAHKLKSVREKLDAIACEKIKFHLKEEAISGDREDNDLNWRQTSSIVNGSEIFGRNKEKEELISMVLANSGDLSVYAICGLGGLGKTTLAQLVFNDKTVEMHFDLRIWVCVSDDFDLKRLISAIIESIDGSPPNNQELDPLQRRLQEKLSGKKFLLVLDDVWNEVPDKWDGLNSTIRCGSAGSAVLVTTRNKNIALMMATAPTYHIGRLSDDDSWSLFEQRAFGSERKEEFAHLESVGRDIVKKCGGVPLAIKAMGSLMRLKRKESEWLSVKESEIWELSNEGSLNILHALRLSYNHLAPHLKQCFAFCSIFPKDRVMGKDILIGLWMANGFIPCRGQMNSHEKGEEIFGELVWRSFFQEVEEDFLGNVTCKMHDLVHDLAQSIMTDECKSIEPTKVLQVSKMVRHVFIYSNSHQSFPSNSFFKDKSLRSFLWLCHQDRNQQISFYLSGQKHLRVLCLFGLSLEKLPISIDRLKHLRYLDFSNTNIKNVPESTTSLRNLQTLNLSYCYSLYELPKDLNHMKNLVFLDITDCNSLSYMPAEMGQLTHLRKLSMFIVGKENGHGIGELKDLNLEGELCIKKIGNVKSCRDAKNANMTQKKDLKSLNLCWSREAKDNSCTLSEEVLDGLQPHSNLKKLSISNYKGSKFPNWMMELLLPNLVEINLEGCDRCEHLPPFGKLKFLKFLHLVGMRAVKHIGNEVYGNGETSFLSLERLKLESMSGLEEWAMEGGRVIFPVLESLIVIHCYKLAELPIIPSVRALGILGGSEMLIRSVENFTFITTLGIDSFYSLTHLPDGLLQSHTLLENLKIVEMSKLKSLGNQLDKLFALKRLDLKACGELESLAEGICSLNSLETLKISDCGIKSFPPMNGFRGLSSLRVLWIQNCKQFAFLSEEVKHLMALEDLLLNGCPELNPLPESIGNLTALRQLRIWHCQRLSSLPDQIGNWTSLSFLEIRDCPNLMCLPEEIRELKMLRELRIVNCPNLERRCRKERGEDWPKIAHIPDVSFEDLFAPRRINL